MTDMFTIMDGRIAELSARMTVAHQDLNTMRADLMILHATLREMGATRLAVIEATKRANRPAKWAGITRRVLDILRRSPEPLDAEQIAARIVYEAGIAIDDPDTMTALVSRVRETLRRQGARGVLAEDERREWVVSV